MMRLTIVAVIVSIMALGCLAGEQTYGRKLSIPHKTISRYAKKEITEKYPTLTPDHIVAGDIEYEWDLLTEKEYLYTHARLTEEGLSLLENEDINVNPTNHFFIVNFGPISNRALTQVVLFTNEMAYFSSVNKTPILEHDRRRGQVSNFPRLVPINADELMSKAESFALKKHNDLSRDHLLPESIQYSYWVWMKPTNPEKFVIRLLNVQDVKEWDDELLGHMYKCESVVVLPAYYNSVLKMRMPAEVQRGTGWMAQGQPPSKKN